MQKLHSFHILEEHSGKKSVHTHNESRKKNKTHFLIFSVTSGVHVHFQCSRGDTEAEKHTSRRNIHAKNILFCVKAYGSVMLLSHSPLLVSVISHFRPVNMHSMLRAFTYTVTEVNKLCNCWIHPVHQNFK